MRRRTGGRFRVSDRKLIAKGGQSKEVRRRRCFDRKLIEVGRAKEVRHLRCFYRKIDEVIRATPG
jgi:hypothetical protein